MRGLVAGLFVFGAAATAAAAPTEPGELSNPVTPWHNCSACHQFTNPADHAADPAVAPMAWQGSLMANAARDPVFWAGVAIASQDAPGETQLCVRCHAPRAFLEGNGSAIALEELDYDDQGGVSCDFCHRLVDDGVTPPGNAGYTLDDEDVDGVVPRRGPWTYPKGDPGPPHPWSDDATLLGESRMCGTCHDVTTPRPRVDDDGVPMGVLFNEQRTYSEWLGSEFAVPGPEFRSCQDCHMARVEDVPGCEWTALTGATHDEGRRHDLVGAGRHMIGILREIYGATGLAEVPSFYYDRAQEQVDALLSTAATLEVEAPEEVDVGAGLEGLRVTVTNETGHKLPSGYAEGRVMWLEVIASVADEPVWTSGAWDPRAGIEDDPQIHRYEAIAERWEDGVQLHLLLSDHWIIDSRIPPRGLMPNIETDPVGDRYTLTAEGSWPHADAVEYAFEPAQVVDPTPDAPDVLDLRVRLLYLLNTFEYVEFLADENETNASGQTVVDLFDAHGHPEPLVLAEVELALPVVGLTPPPGGAESSSTGSAPPGTSSSTGDGPPLTDSGETAPLPVTSGSEATGDASTAGSSSDAGCGCRAAPRDSVWLLGLILAWIRRRPMGQLSQRR